ncbi:cysteine hydrolase family protein [Neisseria chenwenguii]|uniref:Cysteine hydrolase n=1 Tax=Neisseria chenwenguii TaxID=1853278 RepID=A0A220S559_9NEIS|nr:cysteine hydrolase family protein [Neisseria chenwenguii]ASK28572.1 cysteine hydrolase [Neisseria chenwenguii]ROV57437.1 cysteine hydrolase [Neisseria chenwenguii]
MKPALIVIDVQNEYFGSAGGAFPQWQADETAARIAARIRQAKADGWTVIAIQHISPDDGSVFQRGTHGAALHESVASLLDDCPLVEKAHADSFLNTDLKAVLQERGIEELVLCGIMTQNCITHTAVSPQAGAYKVSVLADCCTAPSEIVHLVALRALADRVVVA